MDLIAHLQNISEHGTDLAAACYRFIWLCLCVWWFFESVKGIHNRYPRWEMDFMFVVGDRIDIFNAYSSYEALCDMRLISKKGRLRAELEILLRLYMVSINGEITAMFICRANKKRIIWFYWLIVTEAKNPLLIDFFFWNILIILFDLTCLVNKTILKSAGNQVKFCFVT